MNIEMRPGVNIEHIHIIDDDEIDRYIMERCAASLFPNITPNLYNSAESFLAWLDSFEQNPVEHEKLKRSLVTMDLHMPGMGGLAALEKLQQRITDGRLSINDFSCMVVTSSANLTDRSAMNGFDFVKFFHTKPITTPSLKKILLDI